MTDSDQASSTILLGGQLVGPGHRPFIVAEMSANHNGSLADALKIIDMAKEAGADAVKIQSYTEDTITLNSDRDEFRIKGGLWEGETLYELYKRAKTPFEWHEPLIDHAHQVGIPLFSAPFDFSAVDLLEGLGCPFYKIASAELVDLPLIDKVARTGKPLIMSTGMGSLSDIQQAVLCARNAGARDIILLRCVSGYPAPSADYNLHHIPDMRERFGTLVGLSDHTQDDIAAIGATALGACLIEKHVTLGKDRGGPDDSFSLDREDLEQLCRVTRACFEALGKATYSPTESETGTLKFRRSLYTVTPIKAGQELTAHNIRSIRPANGLAPKLYWDLLGRRAAVDIPAGTPLSFDLLTDEGETI